jgi:tetratricopeptide (TPR) repeat protein
MRELPLLLIFVCVLHPALALAQQGWAIIGTVQTSHGELPDRAILVTLQFRGNTIATTFSDSEGKFSFSELLANAYHILIDDERFRPIDQIVEINPMLTTPTMVRINLTPREGLKSIAPAPGSNPHLVNSVEFTRQIPKAAIKEFDKGTKSDKEGRIDDAIEHYQKAIRLAPQFYAAHNNLGSDYLGKSQFPEAQQQFEQVVKENPSDAAGYFNLGNLFLLTQQLDKGQQWVEQGLSKQPDSAFGHFLQGSLYARSGKPSQAEASLRRCLELDPIMSKAHLALVNLYLQQRRKDDAASELRAFLKASPDDPFVPRAKQVLQKLEVSSTDSKPQ